MLEVLHGVLIYGWRTFNRKNSNGYEILNKISESLFLKSRLENK